jgi:hypothetical protein
MASVSNLHGEKVGFLKVDIKLENKKTSIFNNPQMLTQSPKHSNTAHDTSMLKVESEMTNLQSSLPLKKYLKITSIIAHIDDINGKKVNLVFKSGVNSIKTDEYISKAG